MRTLKRLTTEPVRLADIKLEDYRKEQIVIYNCPICNREGKTSISRYLKQPVDCRSFCFICKQNRSRLEKYGDAHFRNIKKAKQTKKKKYGDENYTNLSKYKQTCLEKYGVENAFKSELIKDKIKATIKAKYGVEHPAQAPEVRDKMKRTCLEKYGVENALQSDTIKNKIKETRFSRYGSYAPSDYKDKKRKTVLERYGDESFTNLELRKKTCLKRYGVENPMQDPEIAARNRHKIFYKNEYWDSTWEIIYFEYCKACGKNIVRNNTKSFTYIFNGKEHKYYPDFEVDGILVEIKGDQFFDKDGKMINPFDHSQDEFYEAKHQCMLKNQILILRKKDLKEAFDWCRKIDMPIEKVYTASQIKQFSQFLGE